MKSRLRRCILYSLLLWLGIVPLVGVLVLGIFYLASLLPIWLGIALVVFLLTWACMNDFLNRQLEGERIHEETQRIEAEKAEYRKQLRTKYNVLNATKEYKSK